jgi:hypothetical protein
MPLRAQNVLAQMPPCGGCLVCSLADADAHRQESCSVFANERLCHVMLEAGEEEDG